MTTEWKHDFANMKKINPAVVAAAEGYAAEHGLELRQTARQPNPPYPDQNNPMLAYLLQGAQALLDDGHPIHTVIVQTAVHAWFEGNIEGREQAILPVA